LLDKIILLCSILSDIGHEKVIKGNAIIDHLDIFQKS